ncbi:ClpX C4-type zinc finger protein [Bilophila wadsworthia]|uniref:ClpX C4-type zinc finger protein n=1 Tax=Bilophila wadsworthia TaxID=35833 RepID=UPI00242A9642|nr:ClpX C4-type zinc finger protein [Bilophila wadsworthia]
MSEDKLIHCSFCGRSEAECKHLITGKDGVYICGNCVLDCATMLIENQKQEDAEQQKEDGE